MSTQHSTKEAVQNASSGMAGHEDYRPVHEDEHSYLHSHGIPHTHENHTHSHEDGHVHSHDLPEGHSHTHGSHAHTHTNTKQVLNRLSRAIGHLESVKRMVESGRDCSEVLIQLSAVTSALNNTSKIILKDHIEHCLVDAVMSGDQAELDELNHAIDTLLR